MTLAAVDRYDPNAVERVGNRAIVLGASIAGLCAARVLADAFDEVVVVERDSLPEEPTPRAGAPQSGHPHALLAAGQATLEDLFTGFGEALVSAGGLVVDVSRHLVEYQQGDFLASGTERSPSYCASRPLIEHVVRSRVRDLDVVRIHEECRFVDYRTTADGSTVTGVVVRERDGPTKPMGGALVVDATGRTSRTPEWLDSNGFTAPPEDSVGVNVQYSSLRLDRPAGDRRLVSVPANAPRTRGAVLIPIEDGQWDVILVGMHGDGGPTDRDGAFEFADHLPVDLVGDLLRARPWVSDTVQRYPFPASLRRRYEALDRFPEGLLVTGDAISSFNPVYGQGMSVAALDALVLHHALAAGGLDRLGPRFFDRVSPTLDTPWRMATGADYQFSETSASPSLGTTVFNWYFERLLRAAHDDGDVASAYGEVVGLETSPTRLLRPGVLARVFLPIGGDSESLDPSMTDAVPSTEGAAAPEADPSSPRHSAAERSAVADDEPAAERERTHRPT